MSVFISEEALETRNDNVLKQVINEAYFGRTPGIMRCFNAFCDWRSKYVGRSFINAVRHIDIDHDKDLKQFCKEMEREFGLDTFSFIIRNDPQVNLYTYPIYFKLDRRPKDNVKVTNTGYKFKEDIEMSIIICGNTGLIMNDKYSDEQIFGAILHEVGHNFQEYLNGNVHSLHSGVGFLKVLYDILHLLAGNISVLSTLKTYLFTADPTHKALSRWFNSITSDEDRNNIYSYFNFVRGILKVPRYILSSIILVPLAPALRALTGYVDILSKFSLVGIIRSAHGYLGEVIADNFASYYGFGEAAATLLNDMDTTGPAVGFVSKIPIVGHIYNLYMLPGDILLSLGDEHPANAARAYNILQSMKHDVNDPQLSPELRKKLSKEIEQFESTMNNIYDEKSRVSNAQVVQGIFDKAIFNGGSVRYAWNSAMWGDPAIEARKQTDKLRESADIILNTKIV